MYVYSMCIYIYIYIHVLCVYTYIYIYIYIHMFGRSTAEGEQFSADSPRGFRENRAEKKTQLLLNYSYSTSAIQLLLSYCYQT